MDVEESSKIFYTDIRSILWYIMYNGELRLQLPKAARIVGLHKSEKEGNDERSSLNSRNIEYVVSTCVPLNSALGNIKYNYL